MRIVTAAEAVAGIRSGQQVYLHCAAATPSVLLDALVARADELRDVGMIHLHTEGPGPHLAPEMAGHFRHRALFVGPNARAAVNEGRADYVPGLPVRRARSCSTAAPCRSTPSSSTPRRRTSTASARSACRSRRCTRRSGPPGRSSSSSTGRCPGRSATASSTSTTSTSRSRSTSRRTSTRSARSATSSAGSAQHVAELVPDGATLQLGIGAIPAATALALRRPARPRRPHRDVHRRRRRPGRGGRRHRRSQGAQPGQDRGRVRDGHPAALRLRRRQPDGRDALGRLHQRHARDPLVRRDDRDQLGDRGRPAAARSSPTRSDRGSTAGSAARWTSSAARRWRQNGRAIIALPSTAARRHRLADRARRCADGAGVVTTRAHVRTIVTEWGVAELFGRSLRERAAALIAIAHPDHRKHLRSEARRLRLD